MKYFDEEKNIIKALAGTSTYYFIRPPEPVVDNMGGLGSAVYHNESVLKRLEAQRLKAASEAQRQREEAARRQPQLRATTKAELDAARRRTLLYEIQRNLDERAAQVGHSLGANADLNYNQLMANYTAGANAGAALLAPVLTGVTYSGLDFARGDYGWGTAGLGLTFLPGVGPAIRQATPAIQEAKQAVRQTAQNVKQNVKLTAQNVGEQVSEGLRSFGQGPVLQPAYVYSGRVSGTARTPWKLSEPVPSNTLNFLGFELRDGGIHRKPGYWGKLSESTSASGTTSTTVEHPAPKGILVVDRRGNKKPVFKEGSKEVPVYSDLEVTHTAERPVYGEEQYNEFISPVLSGTTYGGIEFVPGAKPVQRTRTVQTGTEPYEYTTTERVLTGTKTVPNGKEPVLNDEVLNPATTYYNTKGKQLKKVRTNTGFGDYNLTTGLYLKRSFGNKVLDNMAQHPWGWGIGATGITMLVGLKNIPSTVGNAGKVVGNTMWNGIGSNFNTTSQQTNDTTPETNPTNTPQTSDTTGRAERMAQRRKELGITE